MSEVTFYKYQGTGNDFILIDNRDRVFPLTNDDLIRTMCHRRFGIGADGFIAIQKEEGFDFRMIYFNSDGREGSMCGNGGRCAVKFAQSLGLVDTSTNFIAVDGEHEARIEQDMIFVKMGLLTPIRAGQGFHYLNTGSPHHVQIVEGLNTIDVAEKGREIRYSDLYRSEGINVNFVEQIGRQHLYVRTYERGVEDETYSCGTGVTAAALICGMLGMNSPVQVKTHGGNLKVSFKRAGRNNFEDIFLAGPADFVFKGTYRIS